MKRVIIITFALVLLLVPFTSFAGSKSVKWDSYLKPGNMIATGAVGWGGGYGYGLNDGFYSDFGLGGGLEVIVAQVKIANVVPLQFGAAGKGFFGFLGWGSGLIAGGYGTAHISFKGIDLPFEYLDNIDSYLGMGLGISLGLVGGSYYGYYNAPPAPFVLGFSFVLGSSYFLNDKVAIYAEEVTIPGFTGYAWTGTLGVLVKM